MCCVWVLKFIKGIHFLNPTDIKNARATSDKFLLNTPEDELSDDFLGIPKTNHCFILLTVRYPMNSSNKQLRNAFRFDSVFTSLHINFTNVLSLHTGILHYVSTLFPLYVY